MTQPPAPTQYQRPQPGSGLAIGSLVLGIVSIVIFCVPYVGALLGVIAVILGIVAIGQVNKGLASGAGMAKTGMVLGVLGIVIGVGWIFAVRAGVNLLGKKVQELNQQIQKEHNQPEQKQIDSQPSTQPDTTMAEPLRWNLATRWPMPSACQLQVYLPHTESIVA